MSIIDLIAKTYFRFKYKELSAAAKSPYVHQEKTLQALIRKGANTAFGKQHNFGSIDSYEQFREQVPVRDYAALLPFISRMLEGEKNVLWKDINTFSRSSGTTSGKSKFIPVSSEGLVNSHIATGKHFLSSFLNSYPESRFFEGKGIVLTGCFYDYPFAGKHDIADVSALLYKHTDTWINYFKSVPRSIALMDDWEHKLEEIANVSIKQNITNISGVATWMLLLFRKILEKTNKKTIAEVWPNLELVIHGGVDFKPYKQQFETLIGKKVVYRNVYNASEGFFAFQSDEEENMMLDLANEIFYEFEDEKTREVFPLKDVELHKKYALIISTNSGLWRYRISDVVQFSSLNPHKLTLEGRTNQFINAFGEELVQANTDKAIAIVCERFKVSVSDYTVAPKYFETGSNGQHEWLIEFDKPPHDLAVFEKDLDDELQRLNSDYEAKRFKNLALSQLTILPVPKGSFAKWLIASNRMGVQAKVPRLSNDRVVMAEIKKLLAICKAIS